MAQNSSSLISSIYKSRKTILEMMKKQNYNTDEYENFSMNEVNSMFSNKQLDMLIEKNNNKTKIYIRYYLAKTIRPQNIQEMIDDLFQLEEILSKNDTLMIIIKDDMNETMINTLKHIWEQDGIFIIIQSIKRLQFNILNHSLVPDHRILSKDEIMTVKSKYNILEDTMFPDKSKYYRICV
jgi:hypothetical protein